jgi:hypothetical protein
MPIVSIDSLPDDARVWVFAARDPVVGDAEHDLLAVTDDFLAAWRAHGHPLTAARDWREARFLCIAVDQHTVGASGCSIDGMFRSLRELEGRVGTSLLTASLLFWRDGTGQVIAGTRQQFADASAAGVVRAETPVFDCTIATLGEWRCHFERPASESWHARWLPLHSSFSPPSSP